MNLKLPTEAEVRATYHQGEEAVVVLFQQIISQITIIEQAINK